MRVKLSLGVAAALLLRLGVVPIAVAQPSSGVTQAAEQQLFRNCLPRAGPEQRQRCDQAVSEQLKALSQTTVLDGGWRLVKTREPGGNSETISAMHTVDSAKSDINFAGLILRCAPGGIQIVLVVLSAVPRTDHLRVILTAGSNRSEFEASSIQGGEALLLPQAATSLATSDWQRAIEVSIEIEAKPNPIRGIVPIGGLSATLQSLSQHCAVK